MSDEPLELPLFEAPQESPEELEALFTDPPEPADQDVVVEKIELGPPERVPKEPPSAPEMPSAITEMPPVATAMSGGEPIDRVTPFRLLPASFGQRLTAGSIDLLVHLAVASLLAAGSATMGVDIALRHLSPLVIAMLAFSFVYHVVPLTFWGRTPGMAVGGVRARATGNLPLSIPQASARFAGLVLTVATLGLGALLALGGRSLADRLSNSGTWKA